MHQADVIRRLRTRMRELHGIGRESVRVLRAPYRVCPLGAHIDHQLGTVTAMAVSEGVYLAYVPSGGTRVSLSSLNYDGQAQFDLNDVRAATAGDWGNYARGAVRALQQRYSLTQGILGVTWGEWGGGGLSSSAAIGLAYLMALEEANQLEAPRAQNIWLDQAIENQYLRLNNGILDQTAILYSRKNHLTVIDCRACGSEPAGTETQKLPNGVRLIGQSSGMPPFVFLVVFSGITEAVTSTPYNLRVRECAAAARELLDGAGRSGTPALLGLVTEDEYRSLKHRLSGPPAKRAAHFFGEIARVRKGITAWQEADLEAFGQAINESGLSSIENYECGCAPLIDLCRILRETPAVYGARFSGAGFRGCCVAMADPNIVGEAVPRILEQYTRLHPKLGPAARALICQSADHAGAIAPISDDSPL